MTYYRTPFKKLCNMANFCHFLPPHTCTCLHAPHHLFCCRHTHLLMPACAHALFLFLHCLPALGRQPRASHQYFVRLRYAFWKNNRSAPSARARASALPSSTCFLNKRAVWQRAAPCPPAVWRAVVLITARHYCVFLPYVVSYYAALVVAPLFGIITRAWRRRLGNGKYLIHARIKPCPAYASLPTDARLPYTSNALLPPSSSYSRRASVCAVPLRTLIRTGDDKASIMASFRKIFMPADSRPHCGARVTARNHRARDARISA